MIDPRMFGGAATTAIPTHRHQAASTRIDAHPVPAHRFEIRFAQYPPRTAITLNVYAPPRPCPPTYRDGLQQHDQHTGSRPDPRQPTTQTQTPTHGTAPS